ncbi:MAG TPA: DNA-3-methyladenine glycosylase 2 family protein [Rhodanobacteraceae bacterium]|nr:DNA-3-methyladenine glycosylase 2 family protein [Rhodanobacteraceae bacterium]
MTVIPRGFDFSLAHAHLGKRDRKLAAWMKKIGSLDRDFSARFDPVDALARAILYQQLSGKAAATIVGRVEKLMPRGKKMTPAGIDGASDEALRAAGVSRNKIAALRDLAAKARAGIVPTHRQLARMGDQELIDHLIQVRGIGRWTVEMMLMFRLGRPDVLPVHDLGIRKGAQVVHRMKEMPKPLELESFGEIWAPYRTLASLYLWKICEAAQPQKTVAGKRKKPVKRSQD